MNYFVLSANMEICDEFIFYNQIENDAAFSILRKLDFLIVAYGKQNIM